MGLTGFRTPLHSRSDACSTDVELHNPAKELLRESGGGPNWRRTSHRVFAMDLFFFGPVRQGKIWTVRSTGGVMSEI